MSRYSHVVHSRGGQDRTLLSLKDTGKVNAFVKMFEKNSSTESGNQKTQKATKLEVPKTKKFNWATRTASFLKKDAAGAKSSKGVVSYESDFKENLGSKISDNLQVTNAAESQSDDAGKQVREKLSSENGGDAADSRQQMEKLQEEFPGYELLFVSSTDNSLTYDKTTVPDIEVEHHEENIYEDLQEGTSSTSLTLNHHYHVLEYPKNVYGSTTSLPVEEANVKGRKKFSAGKKINRFRKALGAKLSRKDGDDRGPGGMHKAVSASTLLEATGPWVQNLKRWWSGDAPTNGSSPYENADLRNKQRRPQISNPVIVSHNGEPPLSIPKSNKMAEDGHSSFNSESSDYNEYSSTEEGSTNNGIETIVAEQPLYQFYEFVSYESDSHQYEDVEYQNQISEMPHKLWSRQIRVMENIQLQVYAQESQTLRCLLFLLEQSTSCLVNCVPTVIGRAWDNYQEPDLPDAGSLQPWQRQLCESKFELLTSEASFCKSFNILQDHFLFNVRPQFDSNDKLMFTQRVNEVRRCSLQLLRDLERSWVRDATMPDFFVVVAQHLASDDFTSAFCEFCCKHADMERILQKVQSKPEGLRAVYRQEDEHKLTFSSFLLLPMQRATRYPLLLKSSLALLEANSVDQEELVKCNNALRAALQMTEKCNREVGHWNLVRRLQFQGLPIMESVSSQQLIKAGTVYSDNSNIQHLLLFSNLLILAESSNSDGQVKVIDYCSRSSVFAVDSGKYATMDITLLQGQNGAPVQFDVRCESEPELRDWLRLLGGHVGHVSRERHVRALFAFTARSPDEMSLNQGDVIAVLDTTADGWMQGKRLSDGMVGWIPGNYTEDLPSHA